MKSTPVTYSDSDIKTKYKIRKGDQAVKSDDVVFGRKICLHVGQHMIESLCFVLP